jgi:predicted alpha/beta-hydrolase family hydrolase
VCGVSSAFTLDTPRGPTAGLLDVPAGASAVVVLGHGAGSGMASPFMAGIAGALVELGLAVARFDFPYMHAGRKAPDAAPALVETWRLARAAVAEETGLPIVAGGKSLGGRIASMAVAEGMPAEALVFLGYPLHPPGRPEKLRRDHLDQVAVPMLFLQGSRDPFARPDLLAETVAGLSGRATLVTVENGDHSFRVPGGPRDGAAIGAGLAPAVAGFVSDVIACG